MIWQRISKIGITLIALIITIIVLLILAGVALATLTGEGSIIGNAENAVGKYNNSVLKEQQLLNEIEQLFKENINSDVEQGEPIEITIVSNVTGGSVSGDTIIECNKGDTIKEALSNANIIIDPDEEYILYKLEIEGIGEFNNLEELKLSEIVLNNSISIKPIFEEDIIGTDPVNPEEGDGIPDKYQAVVYFSPINASLNFNMAVVTLYNDERELDEYGVGYLSENQIPTVTVLDGYDPDSVRWRPSEPTVTQEITSNCTFIVEASAIMVVPVPSTP